LAPASKAEGDATQDAMGKSLEDIIKSIPETVSEM